jgi:hypothetical protein
MTGISDATQPVVVFRGAPVPISVAHSRLIHISLLVPRWEADQALTDPDESPRQALFAAAMQIISDRTLLPFRFGPAKLPLDDAGSDALELPSSKLDAALAWL